MLTGAVDLWEYSSPEWLIVKATVVSEWDRGFLLCALKSPRSNYCSSWQLVGVSQWCSPSRLCGFCHWWSSCFFSDFVHYTSKRRANEQHSSFSFPFPISRFKAEVITFHAFVHDGEIWCRFQTLLQQQHIHAPLCWKFTNRLLAALSCYSLWIYLGRCKKRLWFLPLDWHKLFELVESSLP